MVGPDFSWCDGKSWAFQGSHTGGFDEFYIGGSLIGVSPYGNSVIVDGFAVTILNASGGNKTHTFQVYTSALSGSVVAHTLKQSTIADSISECSSFYPLNIPSELTNQPLVRITGDPGVGIEIVLLSAWGRVLAPQMPVEPAPVSVQEFHIFPKKKVSGPV